MAAIVHWRLGIRKKKRETVTKNDAAKILHLVMQGFMFCHLKQRKKHRFLHWLLRHQTARRWESTLISLGQMGAYHALDLELNRPFTLSKQEWDSVVLECIDMACDPTQNADLAAIVMQNGIAHVCLVTNSMTLVRAKIESCIPRKRKGMCNQHTKGLNRFYDQIM